MRILVIYCHPVETSYSAALHGQVLHSLRGAGHEVDDCDLYAEGFNPVLTRAEHLGYHEVPGNRLPVQGYVERLLRAEAVVFCFPTWSFGMPAMLKGFVDRVLVPGVAFEICDRCNIRPALTHIKRICAVVTYGRPRWTAMLMGDPPRKSITRHMRLLTGGKARVDYHACYYMDAATPLRLQAFKERVGLAMARFA